MEDTLFDRFRCPEEYRIHLDAAKAQAALGWDRDGAALEARLTPVAEELGIPVHALFAMMVLCRAPELKQTYSKYPNADVLYRGFEADVAGKLQERRNRIGEWGFGPGLASWYWRFFNEIIFGLGRLQFETYPWDLADLPPYVKKGDMILKLHIPTGGHLTPEAAMDSLRQAYRFYGCTGLMLVQLKSWLIYPPHAALFPEGSNLQKFAGMFHVMEQHTRGTRNLWRIFGISFRGFDGDWSKVPRDTRLRRAFADWLQAGNEMGTGFGYLLFDGEKVL